MQCSKGSVNPFSQKDFRIATKSLRPEDSGSRFSISWRQYASLPSVWNESHRHLLINSLSTALSPMTLRIAGER